MLVRARFLIAAVLPACGRVGFATTDAPGGGANIVFVTPASFVPGAFAGLAGADAACASTAAAAGLRGTYVAWLGTTATSATDRVAGARGWVRPDGMPFADTVADIAAGQVRTPAALLADGSVELDAAVTEVVTGTNFDGSSDPTGECADWTSTAGSAIAGNLAVTSSEFTRDGGASCATPGRIYCFGVDRDVALTQPSPVAGRRAFLSAAWQPGNGIASADQRCQADAIAAGLTGTYRALIATSTASAASRFDPTGPPWVRLDGLAVAPTAEAFLTTGPIVPLDLGIDGRYRYDVMWTGAATPGAVGAETCVDWTNATPSRLTTTGRPEYARHEFFDFTTTYACSLTGGVYCLEQ